MVVVMGVLVVVLVVFAATTVSARDTQCVLGQASPCCFAAWHLEARWEFRLAVLMKSIALPTACCLCRPWHEPFHLAASSSFILKLLALSLDFFHRRMIATAVENMTCKHLPCFCF